MSVRKEKRSRKLPLPDAIASAFGVKIGVVRWINRFDVIIDQSGIVRFS